MRVLSLIHIYTVFAVTVENFFFGPQAGKVKIINVLFLLAQLIDKHIAAV